MTICLVCKKKGKKQVKKVASITEGDNECKTQAETIKTVDYDTERRMLEQEPVRMS